MDDAAALMRMAAAAARARAATDRDVLWAGQASRRTTGGRSAIGTPGAPEGTPLKEPDDIARLYWDLHTRREPAEHLISA